MKVDIQALRGAVIKHVHPDLQLPIRVALDELAALRALVLLIQDSLKNTTKGAPRAEGERKPAEEVAFLLKQIESMWESK